MQHHEKNELQVAEQLYKQILKTEPDHVESIFHLGSLSVQIGNFERASQLLIKTVQIDPSHFKALNNLGIVFQELEESCDKDVSPWLLRLELDKEQMNHVGITMDDLYYQGHHRWEDFQMTYLHLH